jgi:hypothetical protein
MKFKTATTIAIFIVAATAASFAIAQLFIQAKSDLTNVMPSSTNEVIGRVKES